MRTELAPTRLRIQRVLRITALWVVIGLVAAMAEHAILRGHGHPSLLMDRMDAWFLRSLLAGSLAGGIYVFVLRARLRKLALIPAVGAMALIVPGVCVVVSIIVHAVTGNNGSLKDLIAGLGTWPMVASYGYWTLLMGLTMVLVRYSDQYGGRGFSTLTGRYHKPRQEMRVFMFLDMRSSTSIAEQLGHVKYFELLNSLFADITDPISNARGEIYQYVGDEISVSWPLRRAVSRYRCVRCFLDIRRKMERRAPHYRSRFGVVPVFKAGFHYGHVTTGEVGVLKRERIYSGDVVNTAARIQGSCNDHGVDNLISQDLVDVLRLPPELFTLREIGSIALQGKRSPTRLWTMVHRDGAVPDGADAAKPMVEEAHMVPA